MRDYKDLFFYFMNSNEVDLIKPGGEYGLVVDYTKPESMKVVQFLHELINVRNVIYTDDDIIDNSNSRVSQWTKIQDKLNNLFYKDKIGVLAYCLNTDEDKAGWVFYPMGPDANNYSYKLNNMGYCSIPSTVQNVKEAAVILKELYSYSS